MDPLGETLETVRGTPLRRDLILYKPTLIKSAGRPVFFTFCLSPMKSIILFLILIALIGEGEIIWSGRLDV